MQTALTLIKGDRVDADYRDALPVNMIAVAKPMHGADGYMKSHSGLKLHASGIGIDRGGYWNERLNNHYRVSAKKLITVSKDGAVSTQGDISGSKRVSMAHSFNTQAIVTDGKMWLHDGTALTQITDNDLGTPIDITWIDGYYFLTDGEYIYHTNIANESQIDPLKFATAEFSPDPTLAVDTTSDNQVIAFGRYSVEYFTNRASANFAFQRISGKSIKAGVLGTHCETELDGTFFFLGGGREESPSVHAISSGTYASIASREVDKIISEYEETALIDSVLETRVVDRDKLILVRLPSHTLLFNATVAQKVGVDNAWTIITSDASYGTKWRGVNGVYDPRVGWIYGDNQSTNIGLLDPSIASQYNKPSESILYSPIVNIDGASVDEINIETVNGFQVDADDVTCAISITYDGITYSKEWWKLYGKKDDYRTRFTIRRLGYAANNIGFKLRTVSKAVTAFLFIKIDYG